MPLKPMKLVSVVNFNGFKAGNKQIKPFEDFYSQFIFA